MRTNRLNSEFLLGSHLCREPMPPMPELKHDMELLQKGGFNLVKLQEHWMIDEPLEGEYDFSRYEELIAYAATLDMSVYLGLTCEQAPHWLYEKHPDCRMVMRDGTPVMYEAATTLPADGKPGPCFDHPGAMADQLRFITKLVEVLGAFENVMVWNTWQEIGYWGDGLVGQHVCYCPNTIGAWQDWLREKYGDLDTLNRGWRTRYLDWRSVQPERVARKRPCPCAQGFEWRTFMDNAQIAHVLRSRADAIRAADPLKRPVFAHKGGPAFAAGTDWTYARCQDFLGSSYYPAWNSLYEWDDGGTRPFERHGALMTEMWDAVAYRCDHMRSANIPGKPVWAAEFQGGPVSTNMHKGRVPSADDFRRWMLTVIGSGATTISFWVTRAEIMAAEVNGFSLLDSVGDTSPRFEEASRIGRALNRFPELFGEANKPQAQVAIVLGEANAQFCTVWGEAIRHLQYSVRGWYRLLWDASIPVDFVEMSQLNEERVADYKALILPFPVLLSDADGDNLGAYVNQGGNLISEACPGRFDEFGFARRGEIASALAELFGVRHAGLTLIREPEGGTRWSPPERTWGEYADEAMLEGAGPLAGHRLRANMYLQTFEPLGATAVLHTGGKVAGVMRESGDGTAWLLGTYAGHSGTAYIDTDTRECVRAILTACGVRPEHEGKLLLRKRAASGKEAWILTNPTNEPQTESLQLPASGKVEDLLGEPVQRNGNAIEITVEPLDVRVLIIQL